MLEFLEPFCTIRGNVGAAWTVYVLIYAINHVLMCMSVRPEKFQFLEEGQNRNFDYKIVISVKNPKLII